MPASLSIDAPKPGVRADGSQHRESGVDIDEGLRFQLQEFAQLLAAEQSGPLEPREVVRFAARTMPNGEHAGLTLIRDNEEPVTVASTSNVANQVDAIQYDSGEGPCLEAIEQHDFIRADDLRVDRHWPRFAARTVANTPVRSMFSVRLMLRGNDRAALNFYAMRPNAFTDLDIGVAALHSSVASLSLQAALAREKAQNLEMALESSRQVGMAIGILMSSQLVTAEQAYTQLHAASQHMHRRLRDVAGEVVETGTLPDPAQPNRSG